MKKLLVLLALLAAPIQAQTTSSNDVTVWITDSEFEDPSITEDGGTVEFDFDEDLGYGISFNHYWTNAFSTDLALHHIGADTTAVAGDLGRFDVGDIEANIVTALAQWHFRRASRFSPYIGAGVAHVRGSFDIAGNEEEDESFDFESETTWVVNFGADINVTERMAIVLDAKFVSWNSRAEGDDETDSLDISPTLLSAGLRMRF